MNAEPHIGRPTNRVDGPLKVTGAAQYAGEFTAPDLLHGDENGVTVIPAEIASQVAAQAMAVREAEQKRLGEILGPDFHKQFESATRYQ